MNHWDYSSPDYHNLSYHYIIDDTIEIIMYDPHFPITSSLGSHEFFGGALGFPWWQPGSFGDLWLEDLWAKHNWNPSVNREPWKAENSKRATSLTIPKIQLTAISFPKIFNIFEWFWMFEDILCLMSISVRSANRIPWAPVLPFVFPFSHRRVTRSGEPRKPVEPSWRSAHRSSPCCLWRNSAAGYSGTGMGNPVLMAGCLSGKHNGWWLMIDVDIISFPFTYIISKLAFWGIPHFHTHSIGENWRLEWQFLICLCDVYPPGKWTSAIYCSSMIFPFNPPFSAGIFHPSMPEGRYSRVFWHSPFQQTSHNISIIYP